jgi:hypothetical protein
MTFQDAIKQLQGRTQSPTNYWSPQDQEAVRVLNAFIDQNPNDPRAKMLKDYGRRPEIKGKKVPYSSGSYGQTGTFRYYQTPQGLKQINQQIDLYNAAVENRLASQGSSVVERYKVSRDHLFPKIMQPHVQHEAANIALMDRAENRAKGAGLSMRDLINIYGMEERGNVSIGHSEMQKMKEFSELTGYKNPLLKLPIFKDTHLGKVPEEFDMKLFRNDGTFKSMDELGMTGKQYEPLRRTVLTIMRNNPDFDHEYYFNTFESRLPEEFREGVPALGAARPQKNYRVLAEENYMPGGSFSNREKLLKVFNEAKKGGPLGWGTLVGVLGLSGVANAEEFIRGVEAGQVDKSYLDHVIGNLEAYDRASSQRGSQLFQDAASYVGAENFLPAADQAVQDVIQGYSQYNPATSIAMNLGYDVAKDMVTEVPGLVATAFETPSIPTQRSWAHRTIANPPHRAVGLLKNNE